MEKQLSYAALQKQSQEEVDAQELKYQLEDAEEQLASDLKATGRSLTKARRKLPEVILEVPFNSENILQAKRVIEELENGVKELEKLQKELFPVE